MNFSNLKLSFLCNLHTSQWQKSIKGALYWIIYIYTGILTVSVSDDHGYHMKSPRNCCFFMSSRWLKRVASSIFLLGLVVAIVILLLPLWYDSAVYQMATPTCLNNRLSGEIYLKKKNITKAESNNMSTCGVETSPALMKELYIFSHLKQGISPTDGRCNIFSSRKNTQDKVRVTYRLLTRKHHWVDLKMLITKETDRS